MKYKQLETLDYASKDNYMGEIVFNRQDKGLSFRSANAKEGWVDTWIGYKASPYAGLLEFLMDENNKPIVVRLYGKVEIFALDKKTGKRIEEKEE